MGRVKDWRLFGLISPLIGSASLLFVLFFLFLGQVSPAAAGTLPVSCSAGALITAVSLANGTATSDTLVLSEGCTYTLNVVDNVTDGPNGLPSITGRIVISGNGAIIERDGAADPFRLFHLTAGSALTITELTLRFGLLEGNGLAGSGAALLNSGRLSFSAVTVFSNTSSDFDGGGLYNEAGSAWLSQVTFRENKANLDGGALMNNGGAIELNQTLFEGNKAERGGALMLNDSQVQLEEVTFSGNKSDLGGAIFQSAGQATFSGGRFLGNEGASGGGSILIENAGQMTATNAIFSNNSSNFGGAIMNDTSAVWLTNSSFSGNTADSGGGLANFDGEIQLRNTIFWANQATDGPQILNFGGTTVIGTSLIQGSGGSGPGWDGDLGTDGGGNIDANPQFVRLPDPGQGDHGDLHLAPGSPAIDAGNNNPSPVVLPASDLDGQPRRDDIPSAADTGLGSPPIVDLGAYEAQNSAPTAAPDAYETDEDKPLQVANFLDGLLANDDDANGDTLTAVLVDDVAGGDLRLELNGTLVYTPSPNFFGQETFTYRASDGLLQSPATVVTITVNSVPDLPLARPDNYNAQGGQALLVGAPGVLANDDPGDAVSLSAQLESGPSHGALDLKPSGAFTYTAGAGFNGLDTFSYRAGDGLLVSEPVTVTITVGAKVYLPVILRP